MILISVLIRHVVFNYFASCTHAHIVLFKRTCRLVAAHEDFFVTNDKKYQTCLIFGLHVTNDENAVNVARTRGNFVGNYGLPLIKTDRFKNSFVPSKASKVML